MSEGLQKSYVEGVASCFDPPLCASIKRRRKNAFKSQFARRREEVGFTLDWASKGFENSFWGMNGRGHGLNEKENDVLPHGRS